MVTIKGLTFIWQGMKNGWVFRLNELIGRVVSLRKIGRNYLCLLRRLMPEDILFFFALHQFLKPLKPLKKLNLYYGTQVKRIMQPNSLL